MHPRPCRVTVALVLVTACETGRVTRNDQRADRRPTALQRHGQVGDVLAQVAGEVQGRGGALDEDDADVSGFFARSRRHALVEQRVAHPILAASVEDVDALDPGRARNSGIVDEQRLEAGEEHPRVGAGRA